MAGRILIVRLIPACPAAGRFDIWPGCWFAGPAALSQPRGVAPTTTRISAMMRRMTVIVTICSTRRTATFTLPSAATAVPAACQADAPGALVRLDDVGLRRA